MKYTTALVLLVSVTLWVGAAATCETAQTLLGQMVPWPMMSTGIAGRGLEIDRAPDEALTLPDLPPSVRFGLMALGHGSDPGVSCAVCNQLDGPPLLLVDANNNEDLTDDLWHEYDDRTAIHTYNWLIEVMVEFNADGISTRVPYFVGIAAAYSYEKGAYTWNYGGYCHRRGLLSVDGVGYLLAITNLKTTGGYEDPSTLVVAVDIDRDGQLNTLPFSHEVFGPDEPLTLPTGTYRISNIRPDGTRLELERIGDPVPRSRIEIGLAAPPFEGTSSSGDDIVLPDDGTCVTVLLFAASNLGGCPSCGAGSFSMPERAHDLIQVLSGIRGAVRLIIVTDLPVPEPPSVDPTAPIPVYVISDPDAIKLYRRHSGLLVLDKNGVIVAMDQPWYRFENGRPIWNVGFLDPLDVFWIVRRLVSTE